MVEHDGTFYSITVSISSMLGHHLTKFVKGKPKIASVVKDEAMRWLLVEGANLFRMAVSKFHESCEEEDIRQLKELVAASYKKSTNEEPEK